MEFLHQELDLQAGDEVEIALSSRANVMLLDPDNFSKYERGATYHYLGGHAERTPIRLMAPRAGRWHVVVNLGGYPGSVRAGIRVVRDPAVVG